jgi:N-methylhydantoinase B
VNRYRFLRDSNVGEHMKRAELVRDIDELKGKKEELGLRQQDFTQGPSDVYAVLWSAAGGFGDPLERDPAKVKADIDNGDVTEKAALEIYGVVPGDARATERRRSELRARRIYGFPGEVKKLSGKVRFLATENLAVHDNLHYGCAKCATDLGPVSRNYKERCVRNDLPIEASNPIVGDPKRFIDPLPQFRQFCCPGCGLAIENEIALSSDPVLKDVEILSQ